MPFYEYRPKSGECAKCDGCFVDLQKMSDAPHKNCPDCGQACERVIATPMVSIRGESYRAATNAEKRSESRARAAGENAILREESLKKTGQVEGHTHNCALVGCRAERAATPASEQNNHQASVDPKTSNVVDPSAQEANEPKARRYGSFPHLVGDGAKAPAKPAPRK